MKTRNKQGRDVHFPNQAPFRISMKRVDLCNLIMATRMLSEGENRERWRLLHAKLKDDLARLDAPLFGDDNEEALK